MPNDFNQNETIDAFFIKAGFHFLENINIGRLNVKDQIFEAIIFLKSNNLELKQN